MDSNPDSRQPVLYNNAFLIVELLHQFALVSWSVVLTDYRPWRPVWVMQQILLQHLPVSFRIYIPRDLDNAHATSPGYQTLDHDSTPSHCSWNPYIWVETTLARKQADLKTVHKLNTHSKHILSWWKRNILSMFTLSYVNYFLRPKSFIFNFKLFRKP